jgi:hypothetical protein
MKFQWIWILLALAVVLLFAAVANNISTCGHIEWCGFYR